MYRFSTQTKIRILTPLAFLVFILAASLASQLYPGAFDWRYLVLSSLFSPLDNPEGYGLMAIGLGLSGLLLWPLASYFETVFAPFTLRKAKLVKIFLRTGFLTMVLVAAFMHRPPVYPRLHEHLALVSFTGQVLGLLTVIWLSLRYPESVLSGRSRRITWILFLTLLLVSLVGASLVQLFHYLFPTQGLGWVDLSWHKKGIPPHLSFAFWQWIVTFLVYTYYCVLAWVLRPVKMEKARISRS